MKVKLLAIALLLPFFISAQYDQGGLSMCSYLVFTMDAHSNNLNNGTGFFIRKENRLFFITAKHVITRHEGEEVVLPKFSDSLSIVVDRSNLNRFKFWYIDIKQAKATKWIPFIQDDDVFVYEFKKPYPTKDTIYSIESFIDSPAIKEKINPGLRILVYGFRFYDLTEYKIGLSSPPSLSYFLGTYSDSSLYFKDYDLFDKYIYKTFVIKGDIGPGYSGAPVFLKTSSGTKGKFIFYGMHIGTDTLSRSALIVKPSVVFQEWNKLLKNK